MQLVARGQFISTLIYFIKVNIDLKFAFDQHIIHHINIIIVRTIEIDIFNILVMIELSPN